MQMEKKKDTTATKYCEIAAAKDLELEIEKKGPPPGAGSGAEPQVSNTFRGEHGGRRKTAVINNHPENGRKNQPQWLAQSADESTQQPSRLVSWSVKGRPVVRGLDSGSDTQQGLAAGLGSHDL